VAFNIAIGWDAEPTSLKASLPGGSLVTPRGLGPLEHLEKAMEASWFHPFNQPPRVPESSAIALAAQIALGKQINELRLRRVALVGVWIRELASQQEELATAADPALRRFADKPTLVFLRILNLIGSPAAKFLEDMHGGLADFGTPVRSGLFQAAKPGHPRLSVEELLQQAPKKNKNLVERLWRHHPHAKEMWRQGESAEMSGALGPACCLSGWDGDSSVVFSRKFPVVQSKPVGDELADPVVMKEEIRGCVDLSPSPAGSCYNEIWHPAERIVCSDAETIEAEMRASQLAFGEAPQGTKDDLVKAYHQVGRSRRRVRIVQLFWDPARRQVVGREQYSQDFGGAGAVTNCNVIFRCLRDVAARWLFVNIDNYFDDYWSWEPSWSVASARFSVRRVFELLGYALHTGKRREGKQIPLIGLVFESTIAGPVISNKPCRQQPLAKELETIAASSPHYGSASSAIGKTVFASKGLQGRAGVHARRPLYAALQRLDCGDRSDSWPPEVVVAFMLWARLLRAASPRVRNALQDLSAAVLYGDAALSSSRAAAMLAWDGRKEAFSVELPTDVMRRLGPKEEHAINGAEVWWIAKALEVWGPALRGRSLLCFGDNVAAIAGCVSGYSKSVYVANMVGVVHLLLCEYDITCWFEWVHTASNPLDGASRPNWQRELHALGADIRLVSPHLKLDLSVFHPVG
jgi:hypothetical protein